jgi:hypothetical protein
MSIQVVENLVHEAERLTFGERLTLIQRLLDSLRKTSASSVQSGELSVQQRLKQVLAKPAGRKHPHLCQHCSILAAAAQ